MGGNYRLEAIQARFLKVKIKHLYKWTKERREIANWYYSLLDPKVLVKRTVDETQHVYHIFSILIPEKNRITSILDKSQIGYNFHYPRTIPDHLFYSRIVSNPENNKNAKIWSSAQLSLPIYPGLKLSEVQFIANLINNEID